MVGSEGTNILDGRVQALGFVLPGSWGENYVPLPLRKRLLLLSVQVLLSPTASATY